MIIRLQITQNILINSYSTSVNKYNHNCGWNTWQNKVPVGQASLSFMNVNYDKFYDHTKNVYEIFLL